VVETLAVVDDGFAIVVGEELRMQHFLLVHADAPFRI
jgi:hypothetical protein